MFASKIISKIQYITYILYASSDISGLNKWESKPHVIIFLLLINRSDFLCVFVFACLSNNDFDSWSQSLLSDLKPCIINTMGNLYNKTLPSPFYRNYISSIAIIISPFYSSGFLSYLKVSLPHSSCSGLKEERLHRGVLSPSCMDYTITHLAAQSIPSTAVILLKRVKEQCSE